MAERRAETIDIGRGIQYAKVASRLAIFHEQNTRCTVETSYEWKEGWVIFAAKVTTGKGTFSGHSMAKVGSKDKGFEKQETIAVGRALAFAGYLSSGEIACQEEMESVREDVVTIQHLRQLQTAWAATRSQALRGMTQDHKAITFANWVKSVLAPDAEEWSLDATDWRQWTPEDLKACHEALRNETAIDEDSGSDE